MSEYSIESTLAYVNYNIKEALIATYTAPILLREYPEVLKLARKLGITISTEIPDARIFTSLCKLILSIRCWFATPANQWMSMFSTEESNSCFV
jgi:hypothetical protein